MLRLNWQRWIANVLESPTSRRSRRTSGTAPRTRRLRCEQLEYRRMLAPLMVTTASDAVTHTGISLRDAIATANADARSGTSDMITFAANVGTIDLLQGVLELGAGGAGSGVIAIDGGNQITVSGNSASTVFQVDPGVTADLNGLSVTEGNRLLGGSAILNLGTLTLAGSTVSASGGQFVDGGAIENFNGTLNLDILHTLE